MKDIWFIFLIPVLMILLIAGVSGLTFFVIDEFGFFGLLGAAAILGAIRLIFSFIDGIKGNATDEDREDSYTTDDEPKKSRSYREVGLFDIRSDGSTDNCTNCKHYSGGGCTMQKGDPDCLHTCFWFSREE